MDYLDYLVDEFKERIEYLKDGLARGNLASIDDYKYVCGQLRGLETACGVIQDLKKRLENSDDE